MSLSIRHASPGITSQRTCKQALMYDTILTTSKCRNKPSKSMFFSCIVAPFPQSMILNMVPLLLALLDYLVDHLAISWLMSIIETLITMEDGIIRWCIGMKVI